MSKLLAFGLRVEKPHGRNATSPLTARCAVSTPAEPIAIAATPDDATLVVSSGWSSKLAAFDGKSLASRFEAKLAREPRSVVISDDGKTAFVSHAVGSLLSVVDLAGAKHETKEVALRGFGPGEIRQVETRKKEIAKLRATDPTAADAMQKDFDSEPSKKARLGRPSCQGFALAKSAAVAGRIFAPEVTVDPGDPEQRPDGYGDENQATEQPSIAVVDEDQQIAFPSSLTFGREAMFRRRGGAEARDPHPDCLLPRAAVIDPKTKSLLVTCYGIDSVVAYDATSGNPLASERRRWTVGSGPAGGELWLGGPRVGDPQHRAGSAREGVSGSRAIHRAPRSARPRVTQPKAADALASLAAKGYHVVYFTARPEWLTGRTREFLTANGFPAGTVHTTTGLTGALGGAAATFKTDELTRLAGHGLVIDWAFGNKASDTDAYDAAKVPAAHRIFLGVTDAHGGKRIDGYAEILPTLAALPATCK